MADIEQHVSLTRPEFSKPFKVLIVVAPYYGDIAARLIAGATAEILAAGGQVEQVEVPGALEIPTAVGIAERLPITSWERGQCRGVGCLQGSGGQVLKEGRLVWEVPPSREVRVE